MRSYFYVSKIPKEQCSRSYLHGLFLSVAQVQDVWLDSKKGEARIALYDGSSMELVFQKKWIINNSTLHLSRSPISKAESKIKSKEKVEKKESKRKYLYDEYKREAKQRCLDNIQHEKCVMVKKRKKRRNKSYHKLFKKISAEQKTENHQNCSKRKLKQTCGALCRSYLGVKKKKKTPETMEHIDVPIARDTNVKKSLIPVYVERWGKNKLFHVESVSNLRSLIEKEKGVPSTLQLLFHRGKLCRQDHVEFRPYDTFSLLVRGRGGMKTDAITPSSSDEDVYSWLINEVGIEQGILHSYETLSLLNGEYLFKFTADDLVEQFNLPIGIARKIILRRDETTVQLCDFKTPEDVATFIKSVSNKSTHHFETISREIMKLHIDGEVFMSYTKKTFAKDLKHLQIIPFHFTMIIDARDNHVKLSKHETMQTSINVLDTMFKKLHLEKCQATKCMTVSKNYSLRSIYGILTDVNQTENLFLFYFLCENDQMIVESALGGLWKTIRSSLSMWMNMVPEEDRPKLKKPELQKKWICRYITEIDKSLILERKNHFLLVSSTIKINSDNIISANIGQLPEDNFFFKIQRFDRVFVYNPNNFKDGFWRVDGTEEPRMATGAEQQVKDSDISDTIDDPEEQPPRPFRGDSQHIFYRQGFVLPCPENGGTLVERCCEFKSFEIAVKCGVAEQISKFLYETLRFADACLNSRKNGTIYFGVIDKPHGKIEGIALDSDTKSKYTDALQRGKKQGFEGKVADSACSCIGDPVFINVHSFDDLSKRYVIEIDVEPSFDVCEWKVYGINLHNVGVLRKEEKNVLQYFERDGSRSSVIRPEDIAAFIDGKLKPLVERRRLDEEIKYKPNLNQPEKPAAKLSRLLLGKNISFGDSWKIALIGKPTEQQKDDPRWMENFAFVRRLHFSVVFDFDDLSEENGICKHFRNEANSEIIRESTFLEHVQNFQKLANRLCIPIEQKTIWIFSNGRKSEGKFHVPRDEWHTQYSAGISSAVSFFNQPFVIPKERVRILVFLISSDFEGIQDTFNEITKNFGWNPVVILSANQDLYEDFACKVTKERKGKKEMLDNISITNIPWPHVLETLNDLTGFDEIKNVRMPSSSGSPVHVDEKMISSMSDLQILASNQCEHKKFQTEKERKEFNYEQENRFFRGAKVTWWNFFFGTHVLKRHIFASIQEVIENLIRNKRHERKVIPIWLTYEPGSGGTTLGRHLLWEFRNKIRCVEITRITDNTVRQISSIWKIKEPITDGIQPILVLLDDLSHTEYTFDEFKRQLYVEFNGQPVVEGLNCCVIVCHREDFMMKYHPDRRFVFSLTHELHQTEKKWLCEKHKELEVMSQSLGHGDLDQSHLISFMIMRNGFDEAFINNIIEKLIDQIVIDSKEMKLLSYVSLLSYYIPFSRRGRKFFLPIECCDEFMRDPDQRKGDGISWIFRLPESLKILLLIENKENASGQHIRIVQPKLAKSVLENIMSLTKCSLSEIVSSFLNSSFLSANTHGRKDLIDFTYEMFVRRKGFENDDEETISFSQLIEDLRKGNEASNSASGNLEQVQNKACLILEDVFRRFKEYSFAYEIAQTLGRLWSQMKKFDISLEWATEAVELAPIIKRPFCLHTKGCILREKFKEKTKRGKFVPEDAKEYIYLLLESLDMFIESRMSQPGHIFINLSSYHAILTVNMIAKFLTESVVYVSKTNIKNYLLYLEDIPSEIKDVWHGFHTRLKSIKEKAIDAFLDLEHIICFHTVLSESEISNKFKESRTYKLFILKYPSIYMNFSRNFGVDEKEENHFDSPDMQDAWHRGKVLALHGDAFINIFNYIMKMKQNPRQCTKEYVEGQFLEIKKHLSRIQNKIPRDRMNLVCVNVALGLIRGRQRDSVEEIIRKCKQLINLKADNLYLAHFFIMVLMWPAEKMDVEYDNELFGKALKFLNEKRRNEKKNMYSKTEFTSFREKTIVPKAITQFFKKKGKGMASIIHRSEIFYKNEGTFWKDLRIANTLQLLDGFHKIEGNTWCISVENEQGGDAIKIYNLRYYKYPESKISEEPVTFYLGFSINGPVAYAIESKSTQHKTDGRRSPFGEEDMVTHYYKMDKADLTSKLEAIAKIKHKCPHQIQKEEEQLLLDEESITDALELKNMDE